jgi:branched-chain amino acid transport system permease protein
LALLFFNCFNLSSKLLCEWTPVERFIIQLIIYGFGLAVMMRVQPQGLIPEGFSPFRCIGDRFFSAAPTASRVDGPVWAMATLPPQLAPHDELLPVVQVRGLSKSFGGIVACRDLNMDLMRGRIAALVGPNGAGKTTVFNLLTGAIRADAGSVRLNGKQVEDLSPDRIARLGMARSFQNLRLFPRMSALENVMLDCREPSEELWRWPPGAKGGENLVDLMFLPKVVDRVEREIRERAHHWLRTVGLVDAAGTAAGALSFGQQKLVSLARLLGTDADVLLLDEPASGIDSRGVDNILELVGLMRRNGKTICIVEHSLHVVEKLADMVFFMELGHITAQGQIADLTNDPRLAEVYFGTL